MRALLDTHVFVWWALDDRRLSPRVRTIFDDDRAELCFSVVSAWELAIKSTTGRFTALIDLHQSLPMHIERNAMELLPLTLAHALGILELQNHHQDPFDRMLVAQARVEGVPIITADPEIARYDVERIW